jgi:D-alanyl-D-alanine carboxypeptidase
MNRIIILITVLLHIAALIQAQHKTEKNIHYVKLNSQYSKAEAIEGIMHRYTREGLPGTAIAIYSETEGWWEKAAGFSNVEKKTSMQPTHLQYLQSVSKTYMAVAILQLYEQGKLKLDAPMNQYLPAKYSKYLKETEKITVRMLLNHTSGIPDYATHPEFVAFVIQHPLQIFSANDQLKPLSKVPLNFEPGSKYAYSNTNYLLLALIADAITGDHAAFISKNIFVPLRLKQTFYRNGVRYLKHPNLVNSYWDVLNTGEPANISTMQRTNVASMIGDDGIVCTPTEAVLFLKGLMEGKLLSASTMREMQNWVKDETGNNRYGLGLTYVNLGGIEGYGHSGGGVGAGCMLLYVPSKQMYTFLSVNLNVLTETGLSKKVDAMRNEILSQMLQ